MINAREERNQQRKAPNETGKLSHSGVTPRPTTSLPPILPFQSSSPPPLANPYQVRLNVPVGRLASLADQAAVAVEARHVKLGMAAPAVLVVDLPVMRSVRDK